MSKRRLAAAESSANALASHEWWPANTTAAARFTLIFALLVLVSITSFGVYIVRVCLTRQQRASSLSSPVTLIAAKQTSAIDTVVTSIDPSCTGTKTVAAKNASTQARAKKKTESYQSTYQKRNYMYDF